MRQSSSSSPSRAPVLGPCWERGRTRTTLDIINFTPSETAGSRVAGELYRKAFTMRCLRKFCSPMLTRAAPILCPSALKGADRPVPASIFFSRLDGQISFSAPCSLLKAPCTAGNPPPHGAAENSGRALRLHLLGRWPGPAVPKVLDCCTMDSFWTPFWYPVFLYFG